MSGLPMTSFLLPLSSPAMERLRLPKQKSPRCHTVSLLPTMEFQRRTSSASCSSIVANGRNGFVPEKVMIPRWPKCVSEMKKTLDIYAPIHPYIQTFNGCNPRKLCPYAAGCTHQALWHGSGPSPLFHKLYGDARLGAGDAFALDLCIHLNALWTGPLNRAADMGRILVALKRKPDLPRNALTGAVVCVELFDRFTIDRDRIRARARRTCRIDKNMGDIPAIGHDVEACSAAVASERKAITRPGKTGGRGHHSEQKKPS